MLGNLEPIVPVSRFLGLGLDISIVAKIERVGTFGAKAGAVYVFSQLPGGNWIEVSKVILYVFLVMPYWLGLCMLRTHIESRFCNSHVVIFS
jgi:hypothetical protein